MSCFRMGIPEGQGCGLCSGTPRGAARTRRRCSAEQRRSRAERDGGVTRRGGAGAWHGRAGAVPAARLRMSFRLSSAGCASAHGCAFTRVRSGSSLFPGKGEQPPAAPPVTVPAHPPKRGRLLRRGRSRRRPGVRQGGRVARPGTITTFHPVCRSWGTSFLSLPFSSFPFSFSFSFLPFPSHPSVCPSRKMGTLSHLPGTFWSLGNQTMSPGVKGVQALA